MVRAERGRGRRSRPCLSPRAAAHGASAHADGAVQDVLSRRLGGWWAAGPLPGRLTPPPAPQLCLPVGFHMWECAVARTALYHTDSNCSSRTFHRRAGGQMFLQRCDCLTRRNVRGRARARLTRAPGAFGRGSSRRHTASGAAQRDVTSLCCEATVLAWEKRLFLLPQERRPCEREGTAFPVPCAGVFSTAP